jgi:thiamine-phosphate pyrophosphorylase
MAFKSFADCRLYTFVDTAYLNGRTPSDLARRLCEGGADIIQLRAKGMGEDDVRRMAETILPITNEAGVRLVINDHPDIATRLGAPCVHLGQEDFFDAGHRRVSELGLRGIEIGLSTHAPEQCVRAVEAGADYVAIGPIFATSTKPGRKPVTLDYVRWAAANVRAPWFAIGGINLETLDSVLEAGARRICVVSAILNAADPAAACGRFLERIGAAR